MTDTTTAPTTPAGARPGDKPERARSLWGDAARDLLRNPVFIVAALLLLLLTVIALFPQLFTSVKPDACSIDKSRALPEPGHPLGYTLQGCDIYSRIIYGARASMAVGVLVTTIVTLVGGTIGALAGYFGGWLDALLSRLMDVFFAVPLLLGAITLLATQEPGKRTLWMVVLTIAAFGWPSIARIMRGAVIQTKQSDYVTAAKALGASTPRILMRHVIPNAIAPVIVIATISLGGFIVAEATLSFLGIGLDSSTVSWGGDIDQARSSLRVRPEILFWPSLALSICVLSFMLLGDAVRDALDPKLR